MNYENKILQHLGIVAGVCKEIKIIDMIDRQIQKPKRKVSVGTAVQAMILNALGFSNKTLYLTPNFYENRPVDLLIKEGLKASDLHDDCLGTALDALYDYGITELFYRISSQALSTYGIKHRFVHLDTTSFSLHGKYATNENSEKVVKITKGYSKDNNPDLNQVVLSLICSYKSSIPVWLEVLNGNNNDKKSFRKSIQEYKNQFISKQLPYFIADSALYTRKGLNELSDVKWVTRVPETIKEAKEAIENTKKEEMIPSEEDGYWIKEISSHYADENQRWVIVFSQKAYNKQYATLTKKIRKESDEKNKELWHLSKNVYSCKADAEKAAIDFNKKLKYHSVEYTIEEKQRYEKKGRPDKNTVPVNCDYYITGVIKINPLAVNKASRRKGFFIIATNELSEENIKTEQLLSVYKSQGISVERGFRFLKDPLFYAESLYLKSPKRIMSLLMVMGLSLLIYSLAERKIRKALKNTKQFIPNQVGKPTSSPTLRWVFYLFEGVLLLNIRDGTKIKNNVMNFKEEHEIIIRSLGHEVKKMYFL